MADFQSKKLRAGLAGFKDGINSGLDPTLLAPTQLSYATNATMRGIFIHPRPEFTQQTLTFDSPDVQAAFEGGVWQGSCFYKPDAGEERHVCSIGGRIFTVGLVTLNVSEVTGLAGANPDSNPIAWLWQSELWVIINDGASTPIIYDGITCRRAITQTILGTVAAGQLPTDDIGVAMAIQLDTPYTGIDGQTCLIAGYQFSVSTQAAESATISVTALHAVGGTSIPVGSNFINNPNLAGFTADIFSGELGSGQSSPLVQTFFWMTFSAPIPASKTTIVLTVNAIATFDGKASVKTASYPITARDAANPNRVQLRYTKPFDIQHTYTSDPAKVATFGTSLPTVTAATTSEIATTPPVGTSVTIKVSPAYTGAANQTVWFGGEQFSITSQLAPLVGNSVTIIPLDAPNGTKIAGKDIISIPELPVGRMGAYGMGRNWICLADGVSFIGSDIVGGPSGSLNYDYRDGVLKVVENTFLAGGGSFRIPVSGDRITAMVFCANLDASLGQGPLQVFIQTGAFTCQAPVDRSLWTKLTNPILAQSLINNGALSQSGSVVCNSDIIFRSTDGIRSFIMARRNFSEDGNTPISFEVARVIQDDNSNLLQACSAIVFDNRILMTAGPVPDDGGTYFTKIVSRNNDPLTTQRGKLPPIWEGEWNGLNILQLLLGRVSLVERGYAFARDDNGTLRLYEIQKSVASSQGTEEWSLEGPTMFDDDSGNRQYKRLINGEIWVDSVSGPLSFSAFYRSDDSSEWHLWTEWTEDTDSGTFKPRMGLGEPATVCEENQDRPAREGYEFFFKLVVTGKCRLKGARFMAVTIPEPEFKRPKCQ